MKKLLLEDRTTVQQLERVLAVPFRPKRTVPTLSNLQLDHPDVRNTVTIFSLPFEIYHLIFEAIGDGEDDVIDIVCLGYTNRFFSSVVYNYLAGIWGTEFGNWAGQQIVLASNDTPVGDYPEGLFSPEEEEMLRNKKCKVWVVEGYEYRERTKPAALYNFRYTGYLQESRLKEFKARVYPYLLFERTLQSDPGLTIPQGKDFFPANEKWILRNLTTKEIVRPEAIAIDPERISGPFMPRLGFGEIVIMRTCWSETDRSEIIVNSRGVWAGHRFDITTLARHEQETRGERWGDVSDEVALELETIYNGKYGENWRKIIHKRTDYFRHEEIDPFSAWVSHFYWNPIHDPRNTMTASMRKFRIDLHNNNDHSFVSM
ncbi:hypothetical protein F4678DRAFT_464326 [Xylaria arbuscula]|nr:hypothetical protein F4678DRAFT_464326 [Xylaria arbuscula]